MLEEKGSAYFESLGNRIFSSKHNRDHANPFATTTTECQALAKFEATKGGAKNRNFYSTTSYTNPLRNPFMIAYS
jgi:hypothetical protein